MMPSTTNNLAPPESFGQAVSRSNELLSCCKTAWKIQQQRKQLDPHPQAAAAASPMPVFRLAEIHGSPPESLTVLEEGLTLLRAMEFGLKQLQGLVRRRGHTNDPTQEIGTLVQQLEQDTQELTDFCQQLLQTRRRSKQAKQHWEFVVQWFQHVANHYSTQLQFCLKVRGDVLTEQAQQRKVLLVNPKQKSVSVGRRPASSSTSTSSSLLFDSPLFTAPQSNGKGHSSDSHSLGYSQNGGQTTTNSGYSGYDKSSSAPTSSTSSYYGNGGAGGGARSAGYGGGGYGGSGGGGYGPMTAFAVEGVVGGTGMRQRKAETVSYTRDYTTMDYYSIPPQQEEEEEEKVHQQIQQRKQQRETEKRLNEAQQAETMLGELGQLFGKMSRLISQQGEVLEKIEDDVEAAHADIIAGQEELTNLYGLKKGNRPLIIKTFLILNFLIIFMKAYKR